MAKIRPRVKAPKTAGKGEIIEIKTLINHAMESGQRKDSSGAPIPRQIINRFEVALNGRQVFAADLFPSVSANPYVAFFLKAEESGDLTFTWHDDDGSVYEQTKSIEVT